MDAERLYPLSFHPAMQWKNPVGTGPSYPLARRDCPGGVQYYFIDFGLSSKFEDGEPRSVVGGDALDQEVPELSDLIPYDPFPVDIFTLGNIFHKYFLSVSRVCAQIILDNSNPSRNTETWIFLNHLSNL